MLRKHQIDNYLTAEHTNPYKSKDAKNVGFQVTRRCIANHIREHVRPTSGAFSRILALPHTNRTKLSR